MYEIKSGDTLQETFPFTLVVAGSAQTSFVGWTVTCQFNNTSTGIDTYQGAVTVGSPSSSLTVVASTQGWTAGIYEFDFRFRDSAGSLVATSQTFQMRVIPSETP